MTFPVKTKQLFMTFHNKLIWLSDINYTPWKHCQAFGMYLRINTQKRYPQIIASLDYQRQPTFELYHSVLLRERCLNNGYLIIVKSSI